MEPLPSPQRHLHVRRKSIESVTCSTSCDAAQIAWRMAHRVKQQILKTLVKHSVYFFALCLTHIFIVHRISTIFFLKYVLNQKDRHGHVVDVHWRTAPLHVRQHGSCDVALLNVWTETRILAILSFSWTLKVLTHAVCKSHDGRFKSGHCYTVFVWCGRDFNSSSSGEWRT